MAPKMVSGSWGRNNPWEAHPRHPPQPPEPGLYWDAARPRAPGEAAGYKQWIQRLFIHGMRRELGLGPVRLVTLAKARGPGSESAAFSFARPQGLRGRFPGFPAAFREIYGAVESPERSDDRRCPRGTG